MKARRKSPLDIQVTESHMCSVGVRLKILGQLPFFEGLTHAQLEQANKLFHETGFAPNETIFFAGDPARRLSVVADGRVKLLRHSLSGKNILLDLLRPGELFGSLSFNSGEVYTDTAEAQVQSCVLSISAEDFRGILHQYPGIALKVLDIMTARLLAAQERVSQLSALPVEGRIASVLSMLGRKFGKQSDVGLLIEVPLGREDLAAMTGTTTESASRVMSQFQKEGLIQAGRQWVALSDRARLAELAEEQD
jgi:CRP-like cAMP-binding protein